MWYVLLIFYFQFQIAYKDSFDIMNVAMKSTVVEFQIAYKDSFDIIFIISCTFIW